MTNPQPTPPGEWAEQAACRHGDVNAWYGPHPGVSEALATCQRCPVMDACADHGLRYERFGIWGGMNEHERQRVRRRLNMPEPSLVTI